jgi:hypothetical protein
MVFGRRKGYFAEKLNLVGRLTCAGGASIALLLGAASAANAQTDKIFANQPTRPASA